MRRAARPCLPHAQHHRWLQPGVSPSWWTRRSAGSAWCAFSSDSRSSAGCSSGSW